MKQGITLGVAIKMERLNKGWSQEELGERVGVNFSTISKYERGIKKPSCDVLLKLIKVLELNTNEII